MKLNLKHTFWSNDTACLILIYQKETIFAHVILLIDRLINHQGPCIPSTVSLSSRFLFVPLPAVLAATSRLRLLRDCLSGASLLRLLLLSVDVSRSRLRFDVRLLGRSGSKLCLADARPPALVLGTSKLLRLFAATGRSLLRRDFPDFLDLSEAATLVGVERPEAGCFLLTAAKKYEHTDNTSNTQQHLSGSD